MKDDDQRHGPHGFGCNCPRADYERTGDLATDFRNFSRAIYHLDPLIASLAMMYPGGFKVFTS